MSHHDQQPISNVQWIDRELLQANDYNPNHVASPELRLLAQSILESGWTQPIVARSVDNGRYEIVDGFHRWTVSGR
jgi:ParB-like chromosome segregation protein Spo0J